jgi:hypothetical protein
LDHPKTTHFVWSLLEQKKNNDKTVFVCLELVKIKLGMSSAAADLTK